MCQIIKLKNIVSILLALLILLQSFSKVWIFISFKIDQDYIAKTLCINRDKPEMLCSGKCVLKQRIKAEEENERKEIPQKCKAQKEVFYYLNNFNWQIEPGSDRKSKAKKTYSHQNLCASAFLQSIFQPPDFLTV